MRRFRWSSSGGFSVLVKRTAKYEVPGGSGPTVLGVETPKTLFRRGLLHPSVVVYILIQKFSLGAPHYRLEQHIQDQGVELDRSTMSRYVEEAGGCLGATVCHVMWEQALSSAAVISTDATSAMIQPEKSKEGLRQACKKGTSSPPSSTVITCFSRTPRSTTKTS
jgi:transposase